MDHGPWGENEDWTEKFRRVITDRLGIATGEKYNDIRFNLMAVVPDKRLAISHKLNMLKTNRQIVLEALQQLVKLNHPDLTVSPTSKDITSSNSKDNKVDSGVDGQISQNKLSQGSNKRKVRDENGLDETSATEDDLVVAMPNKVQKKSENILPEEKTSEITSPVINSQEKDIKDDVEKDNCESTDKSDAREEDSPKEEEITNVNENHNAGNLPRENLSKISLIVTSEDNEVVKTEILDAVNKSTNVHNSSSNITDKSPDYSTPLTIQTSPAPSTSSTDTSSEVGSAFNSPTQLNWGWNSGQNSPNSSPAKDFKKFVVIRVAMSNETDKGDSPNSRSNRKDLLNVKKVCLEAGALPKCWEKPLPLGCSSNPKLSSNLKISPLAIDSKIKSIDGSSVILKTNEKSLTDRDAQQHTFAPKDLLALLKNLEGEISLCEGNLRDENEKRKKYKIDDCRRTHNYDEFICTFLSMLAQQGKLADLVQQHLYFQRKPSLQPTGQRAPPQRVHKKSESKISNSSRKSSKKSTKCRKRK